MECVALASRLSPVVARFFSKPSALLADCRGLLHVCRALEVGFRLFSDCELMGR